jgi:membrane protein required for beta-lactamase induction
VINNMTIEVAAASNNYSGAWLVRTRKSASPSQVQDKRKGKVMLYTIAVILLILLLLGLVTSYTMGGVIHVLLVVAIVMVLFSLFQGRRPA